MEKLNRRSDISDAISMNKRKILILTLVAVVGFGFWHGARDVANWVGPHSSSSYAMISLLAEGASYLSIALLSFQGFLARGNLVFRLGICAVLTYCVVLIFLGNTDAAQIVGHVLFGFGTAMLMLSWIAVLSCFKNSYSVVIIMVGYALSVVTQVVSSAFFANSRMILFMFLLLLSIVALYVCLKNTTLINNEMPVRISAETSTEEMFSRFRRAAIGVGVFAFIYGVMLQLDIINSVEYAQTIVSGLLNFGAAILGIVVILLLHKRRINSDNLVPIAAIVLTSILVFRYLHPADEHLSGATLTTFVMFYGVLIWVIFIPEARKRKLSAFFLMGVVLGVDRISVLLGRMTAMQASSLDGFDMVLATILAIWIITLLLSLHFYAYSHALRKQKGNAIPITEDAEELFSPPSEHNQEELLEKLQKQYALSRREAELALEFGSGRSARKIAELQFLSEHTVKTHIKRAYKKMNVHSRQQLLDELSLLEADITPLNI